jgi:hypothetical protein
MQIWWILFVVEALLLALGFVLWDLERRNIEQKRQK